MHFSLPPALTGKQVLDNVWPGKSTPRRPNIDRHRQHMAVINEIGLPSGIVYPQVHTSKTDMRHAKDLLEFEKAGIVRSDLCIVKALARDRSPHFV